MYETLLFDGTDIKTAGVQSIEVWDGVLSTPSVRGDDEHVPLMDGDLYVDKPFDAHQIGIGLVLSAGSKTLFNDTFRTLRRLVKVDGTVTLTRRLSYTAGNEEHTCTARYVSGLDPTLSSAMAVGRLVLVMKNLGGLWYGPAVTIGTGASTVTGDVRTRKLTVTFTGGTNPTLTNTTTGEALTWTGAVGGTPVVVDVGNLSASQGGTDVSAGLSWTKTFPLTLRAGSNTLSLAGGGSVSVAYSPAYL
jgi:hypothetical protein